MISHWSPLVKAPDLFSQKPVQPTSRIRRFGSHPLVRIGLALVFIAPVIVLNNAFSFLVLDEIEGQLKIALQLVKAVVFLLLLAFAYRAFTRRVEAREALELGGADWHREFGVGWLIGGGMVVAIVGVLVLLGSYRVASFNDPLALVTFLFRYGAGSFVEELLFTVVLFRLLEEFVGTPVSFLTVSLLFGLMHFGNDNATVGTSILISIQQITLIAPFILTRRIWMSWAVHFSWNYSQSAVLGMNNSGMAYEGFISPEITGPDLMTGGAFGIEGSILSLLVNLSLGVAMLVAAWRFNQILGPSWRRNRETWS